MIDHIPCVILAGGKSSRFQEDKALYPIKHNTTLLQYQFEKLSIIFSNLFIAAKTKKYDFESSLIKEDSTLYSPLIAIESILSQLENKKIFIIPVDTPNISKQTILSLIEQSKNYQLTIPTTKNKIHPLCGVYSKSLLPIVQQQLQNNNHKIVDLLDKVEDKNICLFHDESQFLNLNTKEDLKQFLP